MPSYEKSAASGLWSCRFREMGADNAIHNKRLSGYKTKREAQFAYEDYIKNEDARKRAIAESMPKPPDPNEITVAYLCRKYLDFTRSRVRESTYLTQKNKAEKRLIPCFENIKINQITPLIVQNWIDSLRDFSFAYQKDLFRILRASCSFGVNYLDTNDFMRRVKPPRNTQRSQEMTVWSPEQFSSAMSKEPDEIYRTLYWFLFLTGCRKGEALALSWHDIDLAAGRVKINKSVTIKTTAGKYAITNPKNESSKRTISLPIYLVALLNEYKKQHGDQAFVFGGDNPLPEENIRRHLRNDAQAAGLPLIRIHDLRHCHASMLISSGVPITAVSKRLGHATVKQTLETYSHMMPSDEYVLSATLTLIFNDSCT